MNDDTSNGIQYSSEEIEKNKSERQVEYFPGAPRKRGLSNLLKTKRQKLIFAAAAAVIVVAVATLVIVLVVRNINSSEEPVTAPAEQFSELNDEFLNFVFHDGSAEELEANIKAFMESHPDETDLVRDARVLLADLYQRDGNPMMAIITLNEGLDAESVSYPDQAVFLSRLERIYETIGENNERIRVLERILRLPEDMVLEAQSWPDVRVLFEERLQQLLTGGGE